MAQGCSEPYLRLPSVTDRQDDTHTRFRSDHSYSSHELISALEGENQVWKTVDFRIFSIKEGKEGLYEIGWQRRKKTNKPINNFCSSFVFYVMAFKVLPCLSPFLPFLCAWERKQLEEYSKSGGGPGADI